MCKMGPGSPLYIMTRSKVRKGSFPYSNEILHIRIREKQSLRKGNLRKPCTQG